jgi:DNA polymerase-3 subunit epsilon
MTRNAAIARIRQLLNGCLILDTETTGLGNNDEIINIAIIDHLGNVLLNEYVMPTVAIHPKATEVHGLTLETLQKKNAKPWAEVSQQVMKVLTASDPVVMYNASFDARMLAQGGIQGVSAECLMKLRAAIEGLTTKLDGGDHSALGDCFATLDLMRRLAETEEAPTEFDDLQQLADELAAVTAQRIALEKQEAELKLLMGQALYERSQYEIVSSCGKRIRSELSVTGVKLADGFTLDQVAKQFPSLVDFNPRLKPASSFLKKLLAQGSETPACFSFEQSYSVRIS